MQSEKGEIKLQGKNVWCVNPLMPGELLDNLSVIWISAILDNNI